MSGWWQGQRALGISLPLASSKILMASPDGAAPPAAAEENLVDSTTTEAVNDEVRQQWELSRLREFWLVRLAPSTTQRWIFMC